MKSSAFALFATLIFSTLKLVKCGEDNAPLLAQMQRMQTQMAAMAEKLESQQKKIDQQDRTLAAMQGPERAIRDSSADKALTAPPPGESGNNPRQPYQLPPVDVTAKAPSHADEDPQKIGGYAQPLWTTRRRFTETRAYVIPEGDFEFECWDTTERSRRQPTISEQKYEAEIGLGNRFQLDIYGLSHSQGNNKGFLFDEHDIELRYAFANWDEIPGNPTAYAEYKFLNTEPDHIELKALFSGDVGCSHRLQWATNLVYETQMGGKRETSHEVTGAVSYQLNDKFSVGGEVKLEMDDEQHKRWDFGLPQLLIGPSFQITPYKKLHIDIAPLVGITKTAPEFKTLFIVGWQF